MFGYVLICLKLACALTRAGCAAPRPFKASWTGKTRAAGGGGLTSGRRGSRGDHGGRVHLCCFVLLCLIQQTYGQERPRKLAIRAWRGAPRLPGTAPVALGSGQPASSPGMDLGGEGAHRRGSPPSTRGGRWRWGHAPARRAAPRSYRRSFATGSASRWSGPTPVRRAPSEKLARRLASAPPDQSAARDDQVLDIGAS